MRRMLTARLADLMALLLSFLLAFVIWVNANQVEDPVVRRALQIPVAFIGIPDDTIILEPSNLNANVLIAYEGPTSILNELTADDFQASVDLSQVPFGEETLVPILLQAENDEIILDAPAPSEMNVLLEQLISAEIPVDLELRGSVPRGYTAGEALVDPNTITVSGLASAVERLDLARVTVFLGNDDTATISEARQLLFYDKQGRVAGVSGLELSQDTVQVTIPINEAEDFTSKVISVDLVGNPARNYRVLNATVDPPSVLVTGPPSLLERSFTVSTEPIDVTGLTETFETRVSLDLPPGITQDEVQEIVATIEIEPLSSTKVFNRPVELLGTDEMLVTTIQPENVRVVLFGPLPVLDALPEQEVVVTLDVFGLVTGTHDVEPTVTIPDRGFELRSIQPSLITVEITRPVPISDTITGTLPLTDTSSSLLLHGPLGVADGAPQVVTSLVLGPPPLHDPRFS